MSADFVVIAGQTLKIFIESAYREPHEYLGNVRRLGPNLYASSRRYGKRGWACVAKFDPPSTMTDLEALITPLGIPVAVEVSSPADGLTLGATVTAYVELGRVQFRNKWVGKTTTLTAPLSIREA